MRCPIPLTPFHFGPGVLVKSLDARRFWLTSFMLANIFIDCEAVVYLLRSDPPLHRHLHTYLAAVPIGLIAGLLPVMGLEMWRRLRTRPKMYRKPPGRFLVHSLIAGELGSLSHVFLDSVMHRDMQPFWPFSAANPCLELVSVRTLHLLCVVTGVAGCVLYALLGAAFGQDADHSK